MMGIGFVRHLWFLTFVTGAALFFVTLKVLLYTDDPNYFPTVIMLGAFLVPVTFVIYVYEREAAPDLPPALVGVTFLWGGVVGVIVAGVLEYDTVRDLTLFPRLVGVGLIEEAAKLVLPMVLFFMGRYRREAHGLVFGAAAGMGFAALETMGYGFVALVQSRGSVGVLEETLLTRGLLAPVGHGAWTGFVCAVLWRGRERGVSGIHTAAAAGAAYVTVALLHAAWDSLASANPTVLIESLGLDLLSLGVALVSLALFIHILREAARPRAAPALAGS